MVDIKYVAMAVFTDSASTLIVEGGARDDFMDFLLEAQAKGVKVPDSLTQMFYDLAALYDPEQ